MLEAAAGGVCCILTPVRCCSMLTQKAGGETESPLESHLPRRGGPVSWTGLGPHTLCDPMEEKNGWTVMGPELSTQLPLLNPCHPGSFSPSTSAQSHSLSAGRKCPVSFPRGGHGPALVPGTPWEAAEKQHSEGERPEAQPMGDDLCGKADGFQCPPLSAPTTHSA